MASAHIDDVERFEETVAKHVGERISSRQAISSKIVGGLAVIAIGALGARWWSDTETIQRHEIQIRDQAEKNREQVRPVSTPPPLTT